MNSLRLPTASSFLGVLLMATSAPLQAQVVDDVVMLGRQHGTEPPAAYFDLREAEPDAFEFERAWMNLRPELRDPDLPGGSADFPPLRPGIQRIFGNYDGAVEGSFRYPLLLGYFADDSGPPAYTVGTVQDHFLNGANPTGTIRDYYQAASNGKVDLQGEAFEWRQGSLTRLEVTAGESGLGGSARTAEFVLSLILQWDDGSVDWGVYDNDGPDGVPNSGDDDGYVDVLTVLHPTQGGECGGADNEDRIWSHRWALSSPLGSSHVTTTPRAGGGTNIRINDYTIQPVLNCSASGINGIGVFAHELGHGFGLPDLYATGSANHSGVGNWGLMGSGSYGCANNNSDRPCMPMAWTREAMGWGTFHDLPIDTDIADLIFRSPVEGGTIYRYRVPGSATYYLMEHRERVSFDTEVRSPGLLIWQIDQDAIDAPGGINSNPDAMGVWLRQADGLNHLGISPGGNRSDSGDPFPGETGATAFHAATNPSARLIAGPAAALTVLDIAAEPGQTRARVMTGQSRVTVQALGSPSALIRVDGVDYAGGEAVVDRAPFDVIELGAEGGTLDGPGTRAGFEGWSDGLTSRERSYLVPIADAMLTANYGAVEYLVSTDLTSGTPGVSPGTITSDPASSEFWFSAGSQVRFTANPALGFVFEGWSGDLSGSDNPILAQVNAPLSIGADFSSVYAVEGPQSVELVAGVDTEVLLTAVGGMGNTVWETVGGSLPEGLTLMAGTGRIYGFPLETGSFEATVRATDSRGLSGELQLFLDVTAPQISITDLTAPFLQSSGGVTPGLTIWLDRAGNDNGRFDLGDAVLYLRRDGGGEASPARVEYLLDAIRIGGGR